jgi:hypothetical protein
MESRFWYCREDLRNLWGKAWGVYFSEKFCNYFSNNVQQILLKEAELRPSRKVGLSTFPTEPYQRIYLPGETSRLDIVISILPYFNSKVTFCWRSKTGNIIHTTDENFDELDLECWIEGIDAKRYWEELTQAKIDHPLKIKDLPFDVEINGVGIHMGLSIDLGDASNADEISQQLANEVEKHNTKSMKKDRAYGIVHNCNYLIKDRQIEFTIDVGSAGIVFVNKLLGVLKRFPEVIKVTVDQ